MTSRTVRLSADRDGDLTKAAQILRAGGLVALPTETVYGLAANALEAPAAAKIYAAKGRPSDNPLIVHVAGLADCVELVSELPDTARDLAAAYWPGPLSIVLPKSPLVPDVVTGGGETVALRSPDHPAFQSVLARAGIPLAAPSANRAGTPSPTTAAHVLADLDGQIDAVLDGGVCRVGVESTVVSLVDGRPRLLRPGGITLEQLQEVLGPVEVDPAVQGDLPAHARPGAPGMKYRHYAPTAPVTILVGSLAAAAEHVANHGGPRAAVLCPQEEVAAFSDSGCAVALGYGAAAAPASLAHGLFAALRQLDNEPEIAQIFARLPADEIGVNLATANRLRKAAGFHAVDLA